MQLLRDLAGALPANVHVWRRKSAWTNHEAVRKYISLLAKSLGELVHTRYVVLLMDVARSHIDVSIFLHARRCGIRLCYVPANMTADLQPCDTHVFAQFKARLREMWRREKSMSFRGVISTQRWVGLISRAVSEVLLKKSWQAAFEANGVLSGQLCLSQRLRQKLGWTEVPEDLAGPPTEAEAAEIFPKRMRLDVLSYVLWEPKSHREKRARAGACVRSVASGSGLVARGRRILPETFLSARKVRTVRTLD